MLLIAKRDRAVYRAEVWGHFDKYFLFNCFTDISKCSAMMLDVTGTVINANADTSVYFFNFYAYGGVLFILRILLTIDFKKSDYSLAYSISVSQYIEP